LPGPRWAGVLCDLPADEMAPEPAWHGRVAVVMARIAAP